MNENSCRLGGNYAYVDLDEIIGKLSAHDQKVFDIIVSGGISQESIAIKRIQEEMIMSFAEITENKSEQTGKHVRRVAEYSRIMAEAVSARLL